MKFKKEARLGIRKGANGSFRELALGAESIAGVIQRRETKTRRCVFPRKISSSSGDSKELTWGLLD